MKVIVTGASGVLGSAIFDELKTDTNLSVQGWAHTSNRSDLVKVDLLDPGKTENAITAFAPDWVIHCAAERRPDVAEKDPEGTRELNVRVPADLAELSVKHDFTLIYISTDYVFDGTSPPYEVDDRPNPVQLYGKTKRDGELAVLGRELPTGQRVVLRVPVLYGPAPKNSDSAINVLVDVVLDQSGKTYKMDHYATRYPTCTRDIASFLRRLTSHPNAKSGLHPILHYSAQEPFTKYEMCLLFANILGLSHQNITPDADAPKGDAAVSRPRDCHLSTRVVEEVLGMDVGAGLFEEYWINALKQ